MINLFIKELGEIKEKVVKIMDWIKWEKITDDRERWDALEKLDWLSYDNADSWIRSAMIQAREDERKRNAI